MHAQETDTRLAERLRGDIATSFPALRELRRRHGCAAETYARMCVVDDAAARHLAGQAFMLAAGEAKQGVEPRGPWRRHLLLLVRESAALWTKDDRLVRLDPSLAARPPGEPVQESALLTAFCDLPARRQGILWYGVVDEEPDTRTALFLGLAPDEVTYAKGSALTDLRRTFLRKHLSRYGAPDCQGYQRLIEEATSPANPRHSQDLQSHLAGCACCATAYDVLLRLRATPRTALADGLLSWAGETYGSAPPVGARSAPRALPMASGRRRRGPASLFGSRRQGIAALRQWWAAWYGDAVRGTGNSGEAPDGAASAQALFPAPGRGATGRRRRPAPQRAAGTPGLAVSLRARAAAGTSRLAAVLTAAARSGPRPGAGPDGGAGNADPGPGWLPSRRFVWVAVAVGVALAPVVLFVRDGGGSSEPAGRGSAVGTATPGPAVTVTTTVSATPTVTASPSRSASPSPSASPSKPTHPTPKPKPKPTHTKHKSPPPAAPPGSRFTQVVNAGTGLCLDIADGDLENGNDVVMAKCGPSDTQRWRVDADLGALQSFADPDFCLDSRGSTDRGVGIWYCDAIGRGTQNLSFSVDTNGIIRPVIALDHAVTPSRRGVGALLELYRVYGNRDQRWTAGAPPV
ncbi:ricin-type beta-trefoil lectin domain protein [Streptomyces sp. NPDC002004]